MVIDLKAEQDWSDTPAAEPQPEPVEEPAGVQYGTKAQILKIKDIEFDELYIPEWKFTVRLRGVTAQERDDYESLLLEMRDGGASVALSNARAKFICSGLLNEDGSQMFTVREAAALGQKSAKAMERIFHRIRQLSGMTQDEEKELVKNSGAGLTDVSNSG